jgi:hypothetical protein
MNPKTVSNDPNGCLNVIIAILVTKTADLLSPSRDAEMHIPSILTFADTANSFHYPLPFYRLCQVQIHPGINSLLQILLHVMSSQSDDWSVNPVAVFFLTDEFCRLIAINIGHLNLKKEKKH